MLNFLNRITNLKTFALILLIYISFPAYFLKNAEEKINELSGKKVSIVDLTMGYNPERTRQMLGEFTPTAREYYAGVEYSVDVVYPIVYALLFSMILILLFRKNRFRTPVWIPILPFIALLFDYFENYNIHTLLTTYPNISETNLILCEITKMCKWLALFPVALLMIYGIIRNLINLIRAK